MQLVLIDWLIIAGFVAVSLLVGWRYYGRASRGVDEYFVSGRRLPWWLAGTSMVATTFAADTPLAVTGLVAKYGLAGNWFWWSFALGGMVTVFLYSRLWRRSGVITDAELIELRYGGRPARALRIFRAVYLALIVNPIIIGWVIKAMMTVLEQTVLFDAQLGDGGKLMVLVTMMCIVGIYATMSGLHGVVVTDLIQFCLAMLGCILLAVIALKHVGGAAQLELQLVDQFGSRDVLRFFPTTSGQDAWMPLYVLVILLTVNWWATWFPGSEPGGGGFIVQRMASCRSERDSMLATLWFQVAHYAVRPWPWLIVAFVALAMQPGLRTSDDPGAAYPALIRQLAPAGLAGLMLVTFLAAFMSTISTQINWGASYLIRDVLQLCKPDLDDKTMASYSRMASVVLLIVGGGVGWAFYRYQVNVDTAWKSLAALGAGTGAVYMLRWFWWRISAWTEISAMIAALAYFVGLQVWWVPGSPPDAAIQSAEVQMAVVAGLTIATWLLVTLALPPETESVLVSFYRKIRPARFGWKPIASVCPEVRSDQDFWVSVACVVLGSVLIYSVLPAVGALIFWSPALLAASLGIAMLSAVGLTLMMRRLSHEK